LSSVAPSKGEIGCVVKRAVRPIRNQPGVLIIRVSRHIENAPENIKLLKRETNMGRVHFPRGLRGRSEIDHTNERDESHPT
jgi:hypothetical protein